jgi:uncharacterized protein YjbI with pentapeptide repeats
MLCKQGGKAVADDAQVKILREEGVVAWNTWRTESRIVPHLVGANLRDLDLTEANLSYANLSNADLSGADLNLARCYRVGLKGANLQYASLSSADLRDADLRGADLRQAVLHLANMRGAVLAEADLRSADLWLADLLGADLTNARLDMAMLVRTSFAEAILQGTDFNASTMANTILADVDLSTVRGLEAVTHAGPSTIGTDTIVRSYPNVNPEIFEFFLRSAGVPDNFIDRLRSPVATPESFSFLHVSSVIRTKTMNSQSACTLT